MGGSYLDAYTHILVNTYPSPFNKLPTSGTPIVTGHLIHHCSDGPMVFCCTLPGVTDGSAVTAVDFGGSTTTTATFAKPLP
jgi:hypothetical protein